MADLDKIDWIEELWNMSDSISITHFRRVIEEHLSPATTCACDEEWPCKFHWEPEPATDECEHNPYECEICNPSIKPDEPKVEQKKENPKPCMCGKCHKVWNHTGYEINYLCDDCIPKIYRTQE